MNQNYFDLDIPTQPNDHKILANVIAGADGFAVAEIATQHQGLTVLVTADSKSAVRLERILRERYHADVRTFPDWETLPYDAFSPHQEIISARLSALFYLQNAKQGIFILPINTLMQRVCPPQFLQHNVLLIKKGDRLVIDKLRLQLENAGYRAVEQVLEHGEFAVRGSLLDLFPMGSAVPFRLDFFDDEIDSIRTFDVDNQRTLEAIECINLLPAHEFPADDKGIEFFRSRFRETFGEIRRDPEHIYQQVSKGTLISGIEYWQPLFFEQMATIFDYLPDHTLFIDNEQNQTQAERFYQDIQQRFESRRVDPMRPLLPPEQLWLRIDEINRNLKNYPRITLKSEKVRSSLRQKNLPITALPELQIQSQQKEPLQNLQRFITQFKGHIIFSVESEGRRETLLDLLAPIKLKPKQIKSLSDAEKQTYSLQISALDNGFIIERKQDEPIAIICETELAEYLLLTYANDAKLYVPVANLHLISRYVGGADEGAPLHKLGSDAWSKARRKAAEKIRDVAAELLDVYAQREAQKGFAFKYDRDEFRQFAATFPFEETIDQEIAINAVISDMCQPKAMDRLVCGDVGFGKTEVAMRAAFLAVMNQKQIAVLVPTTLLAQQHYENFKDRFANLPVNVEMVSRFRTPKEQKRILDDLEQGKVDILIGTHKLIQSDVKFNDLGLLIIDEEHRFGVRQKEKIKQLRANIDILTLTATPIPRTLNMAMNGIRDLSIISTPPARRLTIKTFVKQADDLTVREAILREILRGGQVYYLHNDVASIENTAEKLTALVPEARITVGHGQMRERELERVMSDFYHQRYNVLVCSTIIETGIDVPTANTIIIERADNFGLAQLHQLRGRVGRSHHQAYAYLLTPPPKLMTKDAVKRLEALESLDNLGAGFILATHDLEIRGAGELLGSEQSGQIESIGFSLYMELLESAVNALKEGREPSLEELTQQQVEIDLRVPALLPEDYLGDVNMRLSFYKRIAGAENKNALDELKVELIDRFGALPEATKNLLQIAELRLLAKALKIIKIDGTLHGGFIEFGPNTDLDPMKFLNLIKQQPAVFKFDGPTKFRFNRSLEQHQVRLEFVTNLVKNLLD